MPSNANQASRSHLETQEPIERKPVEVFVKAMSMEENGAPDYGFFLADQNLIEKLKRLESLSIAENLSEVRIIHPTNWGHSNKVDEDDKPRLHSNELVVNSNYFYFSNLPKNFDNPIETQIQPIGDFLKLVESMEPGSTLVLPGCEDPRVEILQMADHEFSGRFKEEPTNLDDLNPVFIWEDNNGKICEFYTIDKAVDAAWNLLCEESFEDMGIIQSDWQILNTFEKIQKLKENFDKIDENEKNLLHNLAQRSW